MIIFTILGMFTSAFFLIVIIISYIEGKERSKQNEKIIWKMDKVETLTGGLENDRLNDRK